MKSYMNIIKLMAEELHSQFVDQYDEPMNGDDIEDLIKEFEGQLKKISGDQEQ